MGILFLKVKDSSKKLINKTTVITKEMKICVKPQIMQAKNASQWFTYFKLIYF